VRDHGNGRGSNSTLLLGVVFLVLGAILSYLPSPRDAFAALDYNEVIGPLLFWSAFAILLLTFPLRSAAKTCLRSLHTRQGAVIFCVYLVIHLFVYGFLLELILASIYGISVPLTPSLIVTTNVFSPPSPVSTLFNLGFNPSISFDLPPVLSGALSFYAVAVAVLVDVLILANIGEARKLRRSSGLGRLRASYVLMPVLGLVLGASCCISVPALVSYAFPSAATGATYDWIYDASYFFFPAFAISILFANLRSTGLILAFLRRETTPSNGT